MAYDPKRYGPVFAGLLNIKEPPSIGKGTPDMFKRIQIAGNTLEALFIEKKIHNFDMARCCHASVMLLHDIIDEALQITEVLKPQESAYISGICYRRKGQKSLSKERFDSVRNLPTYNTLHKVCQQLCNSVKGSPMLGNPIWDATKFAEYCIENEGTGNEHEDVCKRIQLAEIRLLFDHCFAIAVGEQKMAKAV